MNSKCIHYCWFGGKPLPRIVRKCLKSWRKYLPDYKIIRWDETNVDLKECAFIKEAYESQKWAFVADYVRSKVMYEYGGLYFDTDMEIIKPVDFLFEDDAFIGVEDSGKIACGVWYEKKRGSLLAKYLLDYYKSSSGFDVERMYDFSIPKLITNYLSDFGFVEKCNENQVLSNGIRVYTRDYFYPYSFDRQNNMFTDNTCMIHYYDASWIPSADKKSINNIRRFGTEGAKKYDRFKNVIKKILFPIVIIRRRKNIKRAYNEEIEYINRNFEQLTDDDYLVICNKYWMGVRNASAGLFNNIVALTEDSNTYRFVVNKIIESKKKLIIFSGFYDKWEAIIKSIKEIDSSIRIKVLWHGSNAMNVEEYDWIVFKQVFNMLNESLIESIGFVKQTMYEFYKAKGYNVEFVMNNTAIVNNYKKNPSDKIRIGLYASGDRWVKNFYNQLAGASLIDNCVVDVIPLSKKVQEFADLIHLNVVGSDNVSHEEMIKRLASNDINIYITFVECAPILPLESLECGVPCITSNNHHYWKNTNLEKYLVLDCLDDPKQISKRIELCLKKQKEIIKEYKIWKKEYDRLSRQSVQKFLKS